MGKFLIIL